MKGKRERNREERQGEQEGEYQSEIYVSQSKGWGPYVKETEEKKRREPKLKDV